VECFNFAQMKASLKLCINKLYDTHGKSDLKVDWKKFDGGLGELRTSDGLADSCVSSGRAF